ncbi:MAG: hypothetical protein VYA86_06035 [Candidatus Thermoplasmatota archaeon]|nr:hypothetical protein [Candidatus Thermoplasmatota archaeon]
MGTLVMLHGLTGTPEMIRPLAETLCPSGWDILLPRGPFKHPERGHGWWIRDAPPETQLDGNTLSQVDESLASLVSQIPSGPLIVGGFSQGSALAQELLATEHASQIFGVIVIGGKSARPVELRLALAECESKRLISMHGESDHIVPMWQADQTVEIFNEAGWDVTIIRHHKGHMVNLAQQQELINWVQETSQLADNG